MNSKIAKTTAKGQITLPKQWRDQFETDTFQISFGAGALVIKPVYIKNDADETIIFDADRDNDGSGIDADEMIKALKKLS